LDLHKEENRKESKSDFSSGNKGREESIKESRVAMKMQKHRGRKMFVKSRENAFNVHENGSGLMISYD
jgi:hypothetical protein